MLATAAVSVTSKISWVGSIDARVKQRLDRAASSCWVAERAARDVDFELQLAGAAASRSIARLTTHSSISADQAEALGDVEERGRAGSARRRRRASAAAARTGARRLSRRSRIGCASSSKPVLVKRVLDPVDPRQPRLRAAGRCSAVRRRRTRSRPASLTSYIARSASIMLSPVSRWPAIRTSRCRSSS